MNKTIASITLIALGCAAVPAQRHETLLRDWQFSKDSLKWERVTIPHDWAIYGPFDRNQDLQKVAVTQNGEKTATWKTGRTGGLPYVGKGYYTTVVDIPDTAGRSQTLVFDGAMSHARVKVNGREVAYWPYGYNSFEARLDGVARPGANTVEVSLENLPESSRWYPGAGLYRNVRLVDADRVHVPVWGTTVTTPSVTKEAATVRVATELEGVAPKGDVTLTTVVTDASGREVASDTHAFKFFEGRPMVQNLTVRDPKLWSPESPALYTATVTVKEGDRVADKYETRFGIRTVEVRNGEGFFLNGEKRKFKGVCNHHDLGPLGAAVNKSALRHQLQMLKDMGADAVRTAHNMPAPELVELCDEMGLMMMLEPFDDWGFRPKCKNGYGSIFNEWAERDMVNMVRHYRNNPSVVMWSVGNEVPSQWGPDGVAELNFLQDIVHREDPTRPVTCGMDQVKAVVNNGFAAALDVPGFNYRVHLYDEAYPKLPQNVLLGSETTSTVSSRGKYYFPVEKKAQVMRDDHQSSGYDVEYCSWSNLPDDDFAASDDLPWDMGQFVWTGFDYLGEPSPYDTDAWPSHSSLFGIIDLASLPKDRYWLYRSIWNTDDHTLHILPHWTWPGREGEVTPVYVYTDAPKAELFINGRSQGVREKHTGGSNQERYRLMWDDTVYEPGELRVVAYAADGTVQGEKTVRTAGKPYRLSLEADRDTLRADGDDLAYVTVRVLDKDGNVVPDDGREVRFSTKGAGKFRATANGDPTSLRLFHEPVMDLFAGSATAIVQAGEEPGETVLTATARGLKPATLKLETRK